MGTLNILIVELVQYGTTASNTLRRVRLIAYMNKLA